MSALPNQDLRIVPLNQADIPALESIFDEQCRESMERLRWDYSGPSGLLRQIVKDRELSGFAAVAAGRTIGFSFYVIDNDRCSIGDIYISPAWRHLDADRLMAHSIVETVDRIPRLARIECQGVNFGNPGADAVFRARGLTRVDRHFMSVDARSFDALPGGSEKLRESSWAQDIEIRQWKEDDFGRAARIIQGSYQKEDDSAINSQYRTEEGCAELLSVLTDSFWCGQFLPRVSRTAVNRRTGHPVGVLIASNISPGVGHIGQISILPRYQGRGIGRRMIGSVVFEFSTDNIDIVTLAVTATNIRAIQLYQSCGFRLVHAFPVYYWERNLRR